MQYTKDMDISQFKDEAEYVAQMHTGALLNPRIDSTFKALFSQPTQESRDALHSFLEAATDRKISSVRLSANEAPSEFGGQRGVSYDILCEFEDGMAADIEMQAFSRRYDYGKRAEYQVARLETTYLKKGDDWGAAPQVYQITVLDFNYPARGGGGAATEEAARLPVSRYAMRTRDGRELSNTLNIIFIELPKAAAFEETIETNSPLENWAVFLKNADRAEKQEIIHRLTRQEVGLMQAQKSLSSISENRDLWIAQYRQEIADRDQRSSLNAARRMGREEGIGIGRTEVISIGRTEGISIGRTEGKAEAARNAAHILKHAGVDFALIAQSTGLSAEEIAEL